ncbi:hypothetical protein PF005_g17532 [Phytophthora fragariae]|uniref:Ubiquitin-like protease family profile domain-containing protein n=1 Tax=Phytophthora fragariae TaxID=53985 RepID=A0A6A3QY33_9STRA|nr:hypothetical protein PF009_g16528 [Phytophthora fragariae]KAE8994595.1 hypothetical protein PF011_g16668 [Phytophthora fragariae]KAE9068610.1 hypothetical protein PF010_g26995 [Phytophthora fragariae]KAE9085169.1 hypothetical protein PF006_g26315 [Phytophthora fragariae]KAE9096077.1 hypothetical protein PF007_g17140 [Phytophthora fragariae]
MANLIKPITSDRDLIALAAKCDIHIDAVLDSTEVTKPLARDKTYLILLRPADMDIGHWTCVHNGEFFDSMGEGPPTKYGISKYNEFQYQSAHGDYCGIWCVLWLFVKQHKQQQLLKPFHNLNMVVL